MASKQSKNVDPTVRINAAMEKVKSMDVFPPFAGGAPDTEIARIQKVLGIPISGSYRRFTQELGGQNDFGICGVNVEYKDAGTLWATRLMRTEYGLPEKYLVVFTSEGLDEVLALDTSDPQADGEFPVYYLHPPEWKETLTRINDSFVDAFEEYFAIGSSTKKRTGSSKKKKVKRKTGK